MYHIRNYGGFGTHIDRVKRGARAPLGAMMGRIDQNVEMARHPIFFAQFFDEKNYKKDCPTQISLVM